MSELDHLRRVVRRVDDELDLAVVLDLARNRAHADPARAVRIPITVAEPAGGTPSGRTRGPGTPQRRRTRLAVGVALATAVVVALVVVGAGGPHRGPASDVGVVPGTQAPTDAPRRLSGQETLNRTVAAMSAQEACAGATPPGSAQEYTFRLGEEDEDGHGDGVQYFGTAGRTATEQSMLAALMRLVQHPDGVGAVAEHSADAVRIAVEPQEGWGLDRLTIVVDPGTWLPSAVTGWVDGTGTTLDIVWGRECPTRTVTTRP